MKVTSQTIIQHDRQCNRHRRYQGFEKKGDMIITMIHLNQRLDTSMIRFVHFCFITMQRKKDNTISFSIFLVQ